MIAIWPLLLAMQVQSAHAAPAISADSIERLRREARRSEAEFERLARRLVPMRWGSEGSDCDEIVGRFCLTYDSGRPPDPAPEDGRVTDARRIAIEALRAAFTWLPADFATAAPLVRYLVEDQRAQEAASAARMYHVVSGDSVWGPLLSGFAHHAAAQDSTAERLFNEVLPRLGQRDQDRIRDLEWVLEGDDRSRYARLDSADAPEFQRRFWVMADPLFLTPGNESWVEHVSRHVWSRVLARAPVVGDMVRWGEDLEQLTVRYGVPVGRTRTPGTMTSGGTLVEHYDPDQLVFTPPDLLTRGLPPTPLPGRPWELDRLRARSGFAPLTIRRVIAIDHQVTRFPSAGGLLLRVDGRMVLDSTATGRETLETGLFVLDDELRGLLVRHAAAHVRADTADFAFEVPLPAHSSFVYSLEAIEPTTRLAGRARYATDADSGNSPIRLSDPLISYPWGTADLPSHRAHASLRPRANLVLNPADTIGLFAEANGLTPNTPYEVRLTMERASRASLPSRLASWIGTRLGLADRASPTRSEWVALAAADGTATLALEFRAGTRPEGDYVIRVQVLDLSSGRSAETRRVIRFGDRLRHPNR
jgi:hypothetical protein